MKDKKIGKSKDDYKIVISELGISPFNVIKTAFVLIGLIPLLIMCYIIIGKNFLYDLFYGSNGFIAGVAIFISIMGFLYAYKLVSDIVKALLLYSSERKRADEEKTELLLAVTHDLKTPLSVIKTGIQNLLDGIGGAINKFQAKTAQLCLSAVTKATDFITELLTISKISFSRANLRRELVDFGKIVKDEVDGVSELASKNNQTLEHKVVTSDLAIWADGDKLSRAVMNLLSNAVKYTPPEGRIETVVSGDKDTVRLAVVNTGPGILPEELDKIFNRYERLNRYSNVEGIGLGLSLVKDIIDLHKGHLRVESEPNKETKFDIVLPRDLRASRH